MVLHSLYTEKDLLGTRLSHSTPYSIKQVTQAVKAESIEADRAASGTHHGRDVAWLGASTRIERGHLLLHLSIFFLYSLISVYFQEGIRSWL